jgi:HEAT repeat protein
VNTVCHGRAEFRLIRGVIAGLTLLLPLVSVGDEPPDPLDGAFAALRTYDWGPTRELLLPIDIAVTSTHANLEARQRLEGRLLEVLESDAPRAAKDFVCRQLCAMGTARSVPALAALLENPELAHMARAALEHIPGEEATVALREAVSRLKGDLQVGAIHSLGSRADAGSVALLSGLLRSEDARVAGACFAALSRIPSPDAAAAITAYLDGVPLPLRQAADEAALRVARRWLTEGKPQDAAAIYRRFETSDAEQLRCAALQGLLKAEPEQAVARWTAALSGGGDTWRRFVAQLIRQQADDAQIAAICHAWPQMSVAGQTCLLEALSPRRHAVLREAALEAIATGDPQLRLAGIRVLAVSGDAADVPLLAQLATEADAAVQAAAERALAQLQAPDVEDAILELLDASEASQRVAAIHALVARRTAGTSAKLVALAQGQQDAVRLEAFMALQSLADATVAHALVSLLADSPAGKERDAAERAVAKCCGQISPAQRQAEPVLTSLSQASAPQRAALLPALGRIGGSAALPVIQQAMQDSDGGVRDAAVRGLCNWPDATVADQLLEIARTGPRESHRNWALRGYARVIVLKDGATPQEVTAGLREALQLATRVEDKQLVLSRLTAVRCLESLALAVSLLGDEQLHSDALDATVSLAEGMKGSHPQEARAALEKVATSTQDAEMQLYIAKLLWNMQLKAQKEQE